MLVILLCPVAMHCLTVDHDKFISSIMAELSNLFLRESWCSSRVSDFYSVLADIRGEGVGDKWFAGATHGNSPFPGGHILLLCTRFRGRHNFILRIYQGMLSNALSNQYYPYLYGRTKSRSCQDNGFLDLVGEIPREASRKKQVRIRAVGYLDHADHTLHMYLFYSGVLF